MATPVVTPTNASGGPVDETAVLPSVPPGAADETAVLPPVTPGASDETTVPRPVRDEREGGRPSAKAGGGADAEVTAVLPQPPVPPGAADETAVLPPVVGCRGRDGRAASRAG